MVKKRSTKSKTTIYGVDKNPVSMSWSKFFSIMGPIIVALISGVFWYADDRAVSKCDTQKLKIELEHVKVESNHKQTISNMQNEINELNRKLEIKEIHIEVKKHHED